MRKKSELEQTLDLGDAEEKNLTKPQKEKKIKAAETVVSPEQPRQKERIWLFLIIVLLVISNVYTLYKVYELNHTVNHTYVYNMEAVLMQTGMADENRKFEANMAGLEKEIDAAEKKVKSMKDKKLQEEYREMYMKSLTLKRDTLIEEHEKFMKNLLKNINKALSEVAKERKVKVIFSNKSVIFSTNFVKDVTPIVAQKLKVKMEE